MDKDLFFLIVLGMYFAYEAWSAWLRHKSEMNRSQKEE
jgi:hypothetical protein